MNRAVEQIDRSVKQLNRAVKPFDRSVKRFNRSVKRMDRAAKQIDRSVKRTDRAVKRMDRAVKRMDRAVKRMDGAVEQVFPEMGWWRCTAGAASQRDGKAVFLRSRKGSGRIVAFTILCPVLPAVARHLRAASESSPRR